jgi:uncharacterized protein (TIGR02145 family)
MTLKVLRYATLCALTLLCGAWNSQAQQTSPFTVLSNNSDVQSKKLYVEIMYEKPACGDYQAQFRMVNNKGLDTVVAVDSLLNNYGACQLSSDGKRLMRPQAGGYRLRFDLPAGSTPADSLRVCIDAYKMSYRCVGCAAGGSDAIFGPSDIDFFCPYKNTANNDLLACYQRSSREGNWEAWVTDPRDCQPYRIVLMPDNKWWFARNLSYAKDLTNSGNATKGLDGNDASQNNLLFGNYWCPGGLTITHGEAQANSYNAEPAANSTATTGGMTACGAYGALYTWNTAIRLDGRGTEHLYTKFGITSVTQGICPEGWLLPGDADWGMMLNAVEKCSDLTGLTTSPPCNHFYLSNTSGWNGANAAASLKSALSAPPHSQLIDSTIATVALPSWAWRRADYSGKISAPLSLGNDKYGFSILPAGYRKYPSQSVFSNLGNAAHFWSSTQSNNNNNSERAMIRKFDYQNAGAYRSDVQKWSGFSVRCMREALPVMSGISAPDTVSYLASGMVVGLDRQDDTWKYTWSVSSNEISNVAGKVTFLANGTSSASSANSVLAFNGNDVNKSFTLKVEISNGANTKTLTKTIHIVSVAVLITVTPYSVGGVVTATAHAGGSGRYSYAWGDGSQSFTQDNTSSQTIQTAADIPAQTKVWHLRVKDLQTGAVSVQVSAIHTYPAIPANATFCNACANNGTKNVDAWLAPLSDTGSLTNTSAYGLANATDINNGRQNTRRLKDGGFAGNGLAACLQKGTEWYVPAAEEYCRIKAANLHTIVAPNMEGTWISTIQAAQTEKMGITCWYSSEPSGNGPGIAVWAGYLLDDAGATTLSDGKHIACIWRPKD